MVKSKRKTFLNRMLVLIVALVTAFTMFSGAIPSVTAVESFEETLSNQMHNLSGWGYDFMGSGLPNVYNPMKASLNYGSCSTISQGMTNPAFRQTYSRSWFSYWKDGKGRTCYCTQLGVGHNDSKLMQKIDFNEPATISKFYNASTRQLLNNASIYTYKLPTNKTSLPLTSTENCKYGYTWDVELVASQYIVWAISSNVIFNSSYETSYLNCVIAPNSTKKAQFKECYKKMKADILGHGDIPNGMADKDDIKTVMGKAKATCTLTYNASTNRWEGTVSSNSTLSQFSLEKSVSGVSFTWSGSNLKVSATTTGLKNLVSAGTVKFVKTKAKYSSRMDSCAPLLYATTKDPSVKAGSQAKIGFYDHADPVEAYVAFKGNTGGATITKTANDADGQTYTATATNNSALNSAVRFKIKNATTGYYVNAECLNETARTYAFTRSEASATGAVFAVNSNGKFSVSGLPSGKYILIETATAKGYTKSADKTFTITSGKVTTASVVNTENKGNAHIYKYEEDATGNTYVAKSTVSPELNAAVRFKIKASDGKYVTASKTSTAGKYIYSGRNTTGTELPVNASGHLYVVNLPEGKYTLIETKTADGYTKSADIAFTVTNGEASTTNVTNKEQTGSLHIIKKATNDGTTDYIRNMNNYEEIRSVVLFKIRDKKTGLYVTYDSSRYVGGSGHCYFGGLSETGTRFTLSLGADKDGVEAGELVIEGLPVGSYVIEEHEKNAGDFSKIYMKKASNVAATVKYNKKTDVTVTNRFTLPGALTVNKEIVLADSSLDVVTQEMYDKCKFTITNSAGKYVVAKLNSAESGEYTATGYAETEADATVFRLGTSTHTFTVSDLSPKTATGNEKYTVHETAPLGFTCESNDITVELVSTEETEITFRNVQNSGSLSIEKHTEGDKNVAGIRFYITGSDKGGRLISRTVVTDENGKAYIAKLPCGTYTVREDGASVPAGYAVADAQTVTITLDKNTTASFFNDKLTAELSIEKSSEDEENLGNIEFDVYGTSLADGSDIYGKGVTDESGNAKVYLTNENYEYIVDDQGNKIDNIPLGEGYVVSENPDTVHFGYFTADDKTIDLIKPDSEEKIHFHNTLKYAEIELVKVDAENNTTKLSGAEFTVYEDSNNNGQFDDEDKDVEILNDNGDGTYNSNALKLGTYFIKETKAPAGFIADSKAYKVFLKEDSQTFTVTNNSDGTFEEQPIKGKAVVVKVDAEDTETKLSGAEFTVYADTNNNGEYDDEDAVLEVMQEIAEGEYETKLLRVGTYFIRETKAPDGFNLDEGVYTFTIEEDGQIFPVENVPGVGFVEMPEKGVLTLTKVDEEYPDNKLSGAEFAVYEDMNGNKELDDEDIFVENMAEESEGIYKSSELRIGTYFVKEIKAPVGFNLDENTYTAEITKQGDEIEVENEAGVGFLNSPKKGKLVIKKTDAETGELLTGAVFSIIKDTNNNGVYDADEDKLVESANEISTGVYESSELRVGRYFVIETQAPAGFKADNEVYTAEIIDHEQIVEIENRAGEGFVNIPKKGKITVYKFDEKYPDNKLSGAEFSVYRDMDGDEEYTEGVDEFVEILTEVSEGFYESSELRFGVYLVRETKAPYGYYTDKNTYVAYISEDGDVVNIENIEGKGFANAPTEFEFTKTDYVNGAPLPDCGIRIYNEKNEVIFEGYTDEDGRITLTGLGLGKYYYQEFDAPEGYLIDEGTYPFEIKDDGVVVKCELKDKREPAMDIDTPQTGKETDYTIPAILAGVAGLALALAVVFTKKKKN